MTTGSVTYLVQELAGIHDTLTRSAAVAQQPTEPQSSVEIARNSKGVTWTVKVHHANPIEASALAQDISDQLSVRYGGQQQEAEL